MGKFILGFIIGLVFCGLLAVILVFAAMRLGDRKTTVANGSTLILHLEGDQPEQAPVDVPIPFLEGQQAMTMAETWQLLRKAAADDRIKALVIEPAGLSAGWGKLQELRADIVNFKKSGKPVYAYLRGAGTHEYYVASAADKIFMAPEDELDVKGLRSELMYFKGALDKLGVEMEFEHVGKYKDAPDSFTKTGPSPETLEVQNQILDQYFGDIIQVIAEGRKKQPADVRALLDTGPFVGDGALTGGLVDKLLFEDEMYGALKEQLKADVKKVSERDYARTPLAGLDGKSKIALVTGDGEITRGSSDQSFETTGITAAGMVRTLRQVENDSSIKGVILRIDSPGGDGIASDDILHAVKALSQKKPMVISMSDLAASGGYFMAMTGDPIVAYPNTLTGSIGVFFGRPNLRGLYEKIGVKKELLTRGRFAAIDSEYRPLTDDERAKLRTEIEKFYQGFVQRVADGRKRKYDEVEPLAQGRVWLGAQAKKNGLIDELGGLDRALELIKERAKIPASEKVTLVSFPPRRTLFEYILNKPDDASEIDALINSKLVDSRIRTQVRALLGKLPVQSLLHGGVLQLMPYSITVH